MAHKIDIQIPDLGDFEDVEIIEVLVSAGDRVAREDGLITIETDKATMDVPSPQDGVIEALTVGVGDTVSTGDIIGSMSADAEDTVTETTAIGSAAVADDASAVTGERATAPTQKQQTPEVPGETASPQRQPAVASPAAVVAAGGSLPAIDEVGFSEAHASPSVRKLARELGVDLPQVKGTGPKSRVLHDDVKAFVKAILGRGAPVREGPALPQVPKVDFAKFGEIETIDLTRIQKISGPRLQASWIVSVDEFGDENFLYRLRSENTPVQLGVQVLAGPSGMHEWIYGREYPFAGWVAERGVMLPAYALMTKTPPGSWAGWSPTAC